jgi:hypothetical protein
MQPRWVQQTEINPQKEGGSVRAQSKGGRYDADGSGYPLSAHSELGQLMPREARAR